MKWNTYFLFAKEAIMEVIEEKGIEEAMEDVRKMAGYQVFHCKPETKPLHLIEAYDGWLDFMVITRGQYITLLKEDKK